MKIAILCHTGAGGSGVLATELALGLCKLGHDVHVVGERQPFRLSGSLPASTGAEGIYRDLGSSPPPRSLWGQLVDVVRRSFSGRFDKIRKVPEGTLHFHELLSYSYPLFENASLLTLRVANTLARLIEMNSIEIVHAHYAIPHATSALLARESGIDVRVVTTLHGTDVTRVGCAPAFSYTTRHAINKSDAVTAVSKSLIADAEVNLGIKRPIHFIPNWVDARRFYRSEDSKARARYCQPEELLLTHISNFRPVKRSKEVIKIFAKVVEKIPSRLILVGDGPEKQDCIDLAVSLGISGRILSLPPLASVEQILNVADVLLLPSETESFGLVALEAMASGAIAVASNVGGLPELIENERTGYLFPAECIDDMALAVIELHQYRAKAESIRKAAREVAAELYTPELRIGQYVELYSKMLCGRSVEPPGAPGGREAIPPAQSS